MSAPENIKSLLTTEAQAVEKNKAAPSAKDIVDARKALLARVKEIAATGKAESIAKIKARKTSRAFDLCRRRLQVPHEIHAFV